MRILVLLGFCLMTIMCLVNSIDGYSYFQGPVLKKDYDKDLIDGGSFDYGCPGLYCGRSSLNSTHYSECGKCDRGYRVYKQTNGSRNSLCQKCDKNPSTNDW